MSETQTKSENIFGSHDENTIRQFRDVESRAVRAALMSDGHVGYVMPIGGVAAYLDHVSVVGVGVDIACGNCAIKTDMTMKDIGKAPEKIQWQLNKLATEIQETISFGMGRSNKATDAPTDHPLFKNEDAWNILKNRAGYGLSRQLYDKAKIQLGTVGGGNHYVDVFMDEEGFIWVGVHFGSRGLGHGIASGFMAIGQGKTWGDHAPEVEVLLSLKSSMGQDYWELMSLAGQYAYAGREWVARKVVQILGAKEVEMVHNHHNFAWKETHTVIDWSKGDMTMFKPEELIVVRKGATPAWPMQKGFVGGSMGDVSVIIEGANPSDKDTDQSAAATIDRLQEAALYSTVHGAGRVMSRTEAKGKINRKTGKLKISAETGEPVKVGKVTPEMMQNWIRREGVILRGGEVDEAPHVYRRLPEVLKSQKNTVKVLHELKPLIVVMAGSDVHDPYKD
jgi:tRNA-splicing ligase RtcB